MSDTQDDFTDDLSSDTSDSYDADSASAPGAPRPIAEHPRHPKREGLHARQPIAGPHRIPTYPLMHAARAPRVE